MSIVTSKKTEDPTKAIMARFEALTGVEVAFGWLDDPEAATIAAYNFFGSPAGNLPARDTMTPTVQRVDGEVREVTKKAGEAAIKGGDAAAEIGKLAPVLERELKQSVREFSDPPNAPSTIAQKGFNDPLIGEGDGGRILRHAGAKVRPRETS